MVAPAVIGAIVGGSIIGPGLVVGLYYLFVKLARENNSHCGRCRCDQNCCER